MLIYIPCAQCTLYDWAERGVESFFGCVRPSSHTFIPAVHHTCETFIPLLCLKTLHTTSGILYQEAMRLQNMYLLLFSEFLSYFFARCRGSGHEDLNF